MHRVAAYLASATGYSHQHTLASTTLLYATVGRLLGPLIHPSCALVPLSCNPLLAYPTLDCIITTATIIAHTRLQATWPPHPVPPCLPWSPPALAQPQHGQCAMHREAVFFAPARGYRHQHTLPSTTLLQHNGTPPGPSHTPLLCPGAPIMCPPTQPALHLPYVHVSYHPSSPPA